MNWGYFFSNIAYTSPFLHHECISLVYPYTLFPSSLRLSARMASEGSELPRCRGSLASRTKLRKHFCWLYSTDWYILMISKPGLMYHISDGVAISSCHARIPHPRTSNRGSFFFEKLNERFSWFCMCGHGVWFREIDLGSKQRLISEKYS